MGISLRDAFGQLYLACTLVRRSSVYSNRTEFHDHSVTELPAFLVAQFYVKDIVLAFTAAFGNIDCASLLLLMLGDPVTSLQGGVEPALLFPLAESAA